MYVHNYVSTYVCVYVCKYVCARVFMYVCNAMYICMHMETHTHIYTRARARARARALMMMIDVNVHLFRTTTGVLQGCLLSPTIFNIFLERIMADALEDLEGTVSIGGRTIIYYKLYVLLTTLTA